MKPADCRVIVVGKTGSGKSTLCNHLLGHGIFPVYHGMAGQTMVIQQEHIINDRTTFYVVDTPDIFDMGQSADDFVGQLRQLQPADIPTVVLLVVRLDTRFTPTDRRLYGDYIQELSRQYHSNVAIVFTRVEGLGPISEQIKLSSLKELVRETQGRYVAAYHNMNEQQRQKIFHTVLASLGAPIKLTWWDKAKEMFSTFYRSRPIRRLQIFVGVVVGITLVYLWWIGWIPMSGDTESQNRSSVQDSLRSVRSNGSELRVPT